MTSLSAGRRATAKTQSGAAGQQHPLSDSALGQGAAFGQLDVGPGQPPACPRLASQVWPWHRAAGDLCGTGAFSRARPIVRPTGWRWARPPGAPGRIGTPVFKRPSKTFISIRCGGTFGRRCKHEEPGGVATGVCRRSGRTPRIRLPTAGAVKPKGAVASSDHQELVQRQQELARQEQLLAEARTYIAELKRQLFGPKADKLNPEQEEQLRQLAGDLQEQANDRPRRARKCWNRTCRPQDKEKLQTGSSSPASGIPSRRCNWKSSSVVLEPEDKVCGTPSGTRTANRPGNHHRIRIHCRQADLQRNGAAQVCP